MSQIKITGAKQFAASARAVASDAPAMTTEAVDGCADLVVKRTRGKIPSRSGAARRSLRKKKARNMVTITAGGRDAPYYPWLDFGGRTGRKKRTVRRYIPEGRYLYPTLAELGSEFVKIAESSLQKAVRSAGLEMS